MQQLIVNLPGTMHAQQLRAPGRDGGEHDVVMRVTRVRRKFLHVPKTLREPRAIRVLLEQTRMDHIAVGVVHERLYRGECEKCNEK